MPRLINPRATRRISRSTSEYVHFAVPPSTGTCRAVPRCRAPRAITVADRVGAYTEARGAGCAGSSVRDMEPCSSDVRPLASAQTPSGVGFATEECGCRPMAVRPPGRSFGDMLTHVPVSPLPLDRYRLLLGDDDWAELEAAR